MSFSSAECWLFATLVLAVQVTPSVHGLRCSWTNKCSDYDYCCGIADSECCTRSDPGINAVRLILFLLFLFFFFSIMYYCCCRRRTASGGVVYSPAGTRYPVMASLSRQHNWQQSAPYPQELPYPQPTPYPTVVPYPQQTPYPPQDPINPNYGGPPPPAYNQVMAQISVPDTTRIVPQTPPDPDHGTITPIIKHKS